MFLLVSIKNEYRKIMQLIPSLHYETYNSYIISIDRNPEIAGGIRKKSVFFFVISKWTMITYR